MWGVACHMYATKMIYYFFFSSTDTNDCDPHPWYVTFFFPCTPPWLFHLHALLRPYRLEGWRATKAVEVVLKSSLKGHLAEEGAQILNRTVRSGSFVGRTRVPPTLWWMQVGGRMAEGVYVSILSVRPGGKLGFWGGMEEGLMRGGEELDTPISIWKVEACIDGLNWVLWPPPPHKGTQSMCFVVAGKDVRPHLTVSFFAPSVTMVGSAWTESTGSGASAPPVSPDLTAESVSDDMRLRWTDFGCDG